MNGDGTLVSRVSKKAETSEFVIRQYATTLLRGQIDRLNLWETQQHVEVATLAGYFTDYLYMPRITSQDVIRGAISNLDDVMLKEQDGIAYADSYDPDTGRYRGLTLGASTITVSMGGLIVQPATALAQIEAESSDPAGDTPPNAGGAATPDGIPVPAGAGAGVLKEAPTPGTTVKATRFHGTRPLDPTRAVRDISLISEEILALFTTSGLPVSVTVDIESSALERLTDDQITALKENLNTLGFTDWNVE
jgi:hypothetical protein